MIPSLGTELKQEKPGREDDYVRKYQGIHTHKLAEQMRRMRARNVLQKCRAKFLQLSCVWKLFLMQISLLE